MTRDLEQTLRVVAAAPLRLSDANPIGSPVTDAAKPLLIDEGFEHIDGMSILVHPVVANAFGDGSENVTGQMRNTDPWQNEKSHVVCDEWQSLLPSSRIPADPLIAVSDLLRGGTEEQTSKRTLLPIEDEVFHILADGTAEAEVMVFRQQMFEQAGHGLLTNRSIRRGVNSRSYTQCHMWNGGQSEDV